MFAVKGWSLDATSLKTQTEIYRSSKSKIATDQKEEGTSKKRKRKHAQEARQDPEVRPDDVGRLWNQHLEGGKLSKSQKERQHKKQKVEKDRAEKTRSGGSPGPTRKPDSLAKVDRLGDVVPGEALTKEKRKKDKSGERKPRREAREARKVGESAAGIDDDTPPTASTGSSKQRSERKAAQTAETGSKSAPTLTPMQSAMRQKLISARFRHLNETLYTTPSATAVELFSTEPAIFSDYHAGFRQQVTTWPENPLDKFLTEIRRRGKLRPPKSNKFRKAPLDDGQALPRTKGICTVADLGCGDARLAHTLKASDETTTLNLKLLSYDLHSLSPLVTKSDISSLPLGDRTIDVAILCLALMGTNWLSFIEEAFRILRWKGELWIAEIKSRFSRSGGGKSTRKPVEHSVGGKRKQILLQKAAEAKKREQDDVDEERVLQTEVDGVDAVGKEEEEGGKGETTDVATFVAVLKRRGFVLKPPAERSVDVGNRMFVKMEFVKMLDPVKGKEAGKAEAEGRKEARGFGGEKKKAKLKFLTKEGDDEDVETEDEARVLKPCLYKVR